MNDSSSEGKNALRLIHFINVIGNWTRLAKKNFRPGAKIATIFRLSGKYFNRIIIKAF